MRVLALLFAFALAAAAQPAAKFPGATVTWQDILVAKGPATATLAADLTDIATTISVTDGTQYAGFSAVQIENEVILVCTIAANTLNVCPGGRGFSGTTAAAHITGRPVRNTITTHHHNQLAAEMKAVQEALGVNLGNVAATGHSHLAATLPASVVYNNDSYADPLWITSLAKSKVGLGNVENTALSTWAGSPNITAIGTLASGAVPWARLSNVPSTFTPATHSHAIGDLSTVGDWSSKITSGSYSISITGSAGSATSATSATNATNATNQAAYSAGSTARNFTTDFAAAPVLARQWTESNAGTNAPPLSGWWFIDNMRHSNASNNWGLQLAWGWNAASRDTVWLRSADTGTWGAWKQIPVAASSDGTRVGVHQIGCSSGYNSSCDPGGNGQIDYADGAGNADTVDSLHVGTTANTGANQIVRTDASGYIQAGWINPVSGDAGTNGIARVYASHDTYLRYYTLDNFGKQLFNGRVRDASWTWVDDYIALPLATTQWGVFTPRAAQATITSVWCWSDAASTIILSRSDGQDMMAALACNPSGSTTGINGYGVIPVNYSVGMRATSGTAKRIAVGITYTTAY